MSRAGANGKKSTSTSGNKKVGVTTPARKSSVQGGALNHTSHARIKEVMHLSILSPRVGGWADPGEFDILMEARVKFPTPRHLLNVNFPPLLQLMEMCRQRLNVKIPTQGKAHSVNFPWVACPPPPPWGLILIDA